MGFEQVDRSGIKKIGVGLLGYAFMGKAHSNAFRKLDYMMYPQPAIPELVAVCGRNEDAVSEMASRFGYQGYYTNWEEMLMDDRIQLFDNVGPNNVHEEPCVMAAEQGKHVLCEKPLARTTEESKRMVDAAIKNKVKHMVAFNYRFVPAVRKTRDLIQSGALGKIYRTAGGPEFSPVSRCRFTDNLIIRSLLCYFIFRKGKHNIERLTVLSGYFIFML